MAEIVIVFFAGLLIGGVVGGIIGLTLQDIDKNNKDLLQ